MAASKNNGPSERSRLREYRKGMLKGQAKKRAAIRKTAKSSGAAIQTGTWDRRWDRAHAYMRAQASSGGGKVTEEDIRNAMVGRRAAGSTKVRRSVGRKLMKATRAEQRAQRRATRPKKGLR